MAAVTNGEYASRLRRKYGVEDELNRYVSALYEMLAGAIGQEKLVLRAGKVSALKMMRSQSLPDRLCALARLVFEDPTLERATTRAQQRKTIAEIEEAMADLLAHKSVGDAIDKKVSEKMNARHQEYLKDLKLEALRDDSGPETPATQAKLEELEALSQRSLAASALQQLRPQRLAEIVGQESAIKALVAKISSPYPAHVILYGPPGVGKTTAARLVLELAKSRAYTPFAKDAPFVETSGTTLRWDPRETTNPLLGSVHDPIYQGSRREFAEGGVPEPKLGLVTRAHGGVLFIDEIGELDPLLQTRLLKVLEDKRVTFESSYYDENATNVPAYIKRLFKEGAPADFVLIGATTRDPEEIDPAIRSRASEIFFAPLTQTSSRVDRAGRDKTPWRESSARRSAAHCLVHDRGPQSGANCCRRLQPGALPGRSQKEQRTGDAHRRRRARGGANQPARAAHAGACAGVARDRQDVWPRCSQLSRQHHRDRSGRISGRANGQRHDSFQRYSRVDGQGFGLQRDQRVARANRHRRLAISTCTSTSSAAATSTGRRPGLRSSSRSTRPRRRPRCRRTLQLPASSRFKARSAQ